MGILKLSPWKITKVAGSIIIIGALAFLIDWQKILNSILHISLRGIVLTAIFCLLSQLCLSLRWYVMARAAVPGTYSWYLRHFLIAQGASLLTPAAVGSDLYRIVALRRIPGDANKLLLLIVRERLFGLLGYALFYVFCFGYWQFVGETASKHKFFGITAAALALLALFLILSPLAVRRLWPIIVSLLPSLRNKFVNIINSLSHYDGRKSIEILVLSLLGCGLWTVCLFIIASDLGVSISYSVLGMAGVVSELARWIPISIQGIGLREGAFSGVLAVLNYPIETSVLIAGLAYAVNSLILVLMSFVGISWSYFSSRYTDKL